MFVVFLVMAPPSQELEPPANPGRFNGLLRQYFPKGTDLCAHGPVEIAAVAGARDVIAAFHELLRRKRLPDFEPWLDRASGSLVAAFANGVRKDRHAVEAAISSAWSNGQTEGQIGKLKLIKRQMYGRGKLDLLEARVIGLTDRLLRGDQGENTASIRMRMPRGQDRREGEARP